MGNGSVSKAQQSLMSATLQGTLPVSLAGLPKAAAAAVAAAAVEVHFVKLTSVQAT